MRTKAAAMEEKWDATAVEDLGDRMFALEEALASKDKMNMALKTSINAAGRKGREMAMRLLLNGYRNRLLVGLQSRIRLWLIGSKIGNSEGSFAVQYRESMSQKEKLHAKVTGELKAEIQALLAELDALKGLKESTTDRYVQHIELKGEFDALKVGRKASSLRLSILQRIARSRFRLAQCVSRFCLNFKVTCHYRHNCKRLALTFFPRDPGRNFAGFTSYLGFKWPNPNPNPNPRRLHLLLGLQIGNRGSKMSHQAMRRP